jgi:hypothetical protein
VSCVAAGSALGDEEYKANRNDINKHACGKGTYANLNCGRNGKENHKHKNDSEHVEERVQYQA